MQQKILRGTIRYTSAKPARAGRDRGRAYFTFTE